MPPSSLFFSFIFWFLVGHAARDRKVTKPAKHELLPIEVGYWLIGLK
jgi:hypothetical protein